MTAKMGDFYEKWHFTIYNFKFWGLGWGLKIIGPKYQNAHRYSKSCRINRLAYVSLVVFKRYMAPRKSM